MKFFERLLFMTTIITLLCTIAILIIQWRKDSAVWRSIKQAAESRELFKL